MTRPDVALPRVDATAVRAYRARHQAHAGVCLGVISNPFSRTNSRTRLNDRILPRFLPDRRNAVDTRTVHDLDRAIRVLLFDRGVNVLALNGGDGTLHLGVNRLVAMAEEIEAQTGESVPLPRLLFLNGGTLNIVARASGSKGNPITTVRSFVKLAEGKRLGELPTRALNALRVDDSEQGTRYGFVFGSEIVANALEMYTMFGEGYVGLARFFTELLAGITLNTRLWQEHGWKLEPPTTRISIDEISYPRYLAAVAVTIDLSILKGVIRAMRGSEDGQGFPVKLMLETDPAKVVRSIPHLMFERPHDAVCDVPDASRLVMTGGYTLDGEVFLDRTPRGLRRRIEVTRAPFQVHAVAPRS